MLEYLQTNPLLLAPLIFCARVLDVSIGTVRSIIVFRGYRYWAAALGFVETIIWLLAAGQVFQNLDIWYLAVAYALGFATGNVVGIALEARLAFGLELVRAISQNRNIELASKLRQRGYVVTELEGHGDGEVPVEVLLVVEKRRRVPTLLQAINEADPQALWTVSDVRVRPLPQVAGRAKGLGNGVLSIVKKK